MKTKIYDYANNATEIEIKDKPIDYIFVEVITGDEVVTIHYTDNTEETFDSSNCRNTDFNDGSYIVKGSAIEKWLNFGIEDSYKRLYEFDN